MSMKKRAILLSFVGAAILTFGVQPKEAFASKRVQRNKCHCYYYNNNWYEDIIKKPIPKPEARPEEKPEGKPETTPEIDEDSSVSNFELKVVELTNTEREKQGLPALTWDNELSEVAKLKSQDMQNKGYFDHNSPTYGSPFDMMKQFGVFYSSAAENIAKGQRTPEEVVNGWMNSSGHRKNILGNYTHIGIGHTENSNVWTQMFISK